MQVEGSAAAPAAPVNVSLSGELFDEDVEHGTRDACGPVVVVVEGAAAV